MTSLENILNNLYNKKKYIIYILAIIIICIVIYLLVNKENFVEATPIASLNNGIYTITYNSNESGTWTVPSGVTSATFNVVGGKGGGVSIMLQV